MKVNIDLREAFGTAGIANFKRNLAINLLSYSDIKLSGCFNWSRAAKKSEYIWFKGELHKSIVPDKLVYRYAQDFDFTLPFTYEHIMNSLGDLNLFLTYSLPKVKFKSPVISTIHDIILLKTNVEKQSFRNFHETILRHTIHQSSHIITVSEAAKRDLQSYFDLSDDKISIVHNGIDQNQFSKELTNCKRLDLKAKYGLPDHFILYFGGYRLHKNVERLLKAYALLPSLVRKDLKLVITNTNSNLQKLAAELHILQDVFFTGFIDESDKCALYKAANMVYYASLYEGFGVPIIEAQICKIPVITSNTSSMPEASGGFAKLVNPYSIEEIYDAILELYTDTAQRCNLVEMGYKNALQYTWERSASELHTIITKVVQ